MILLPYLKQQNYLIEKEWVSKCWTIFVKPDRNFEMRSYPIDNDNLAMNNYSKCDGISEKLSLQRIRISNWRTPKSSRLK